MSETPLMSQDNGGSTKTSGDTTPKTGEGPKVKRFMNGWSKEQDALMADWADIAGCYRWMHDRSEKLYTEKNMRMTIPVIILTTLTGTASVGLSSIAGPDPDLQRYLNFGIGGLSLIAGILTTLNNFLRYAQLSESNRQAAIAWGKFQRLIAVELALNPNERMDSLDFLKICRADLDRLIEQSPAIPDNVIEAFEREFKDKTSLRRPDICHGLDHTKPFDSSQTRLKAVAADAALMLLNKKKILKQHIVPDLDRMISSAVTENINRKQKELEDIIAERLKAATPSTKKQHSSSLFRAAAETDFNTLIEQRKKVLGVTTIYVPPTVAAPVVAAPVVAAPVVPADSVAVTFGDGDEKNAS